MNDMYSKQPLYRYLVSHMALKEGDEFESSPLDIMIHPDLSRIAPIVETQLESHDYLYATTIRRRLVCDLEDIDAYLRLMEL